MAAELESQFGGSAELIQSSGGVFEIEDNGKLIFSKKELGRFPEEREISGIIEGVASGLDLQAAQQSAAAKPPSFSFSAWMKSLISPKQN